MKKLFLFFSMLLAMGLTSACSSDEENPFVGEWQLVEARYVDSGEIAYPSGEEDGTIRIDHVKFQPNFEYIMYSSNRPELDFPPMTYSYDDDFLTLTDHLGDSRYKYEISENGNVLRLTDRKTPGDLPRPKTISTYKRIK